MNEYIQLYKRALDGGSFGIWEWNLKKDCLYIFGKPETNPQYVEENFKNPYEFFEMFILREDRAGAVNDLDFFINGYTAKYRSEMRISLDHGIKWILVEGKAVRDEQGRIEFISGTISDITERKRIEAEVGVFIYYDALTGLPNRSQFMENLKLVSKEYENCSYDAAVIFIDIDNFKSINDSLGFEYGDLLLKVFSQLLMVCKNDQDSIYRVSGDEFIFFMHKVNSKSEVDKACAKIMEYCKKPFEIRDKKIHISLNMGIAFFPRHTSDINDIFMYVDLAMHKSKLKGKNKITYFESSMSDLYLRKLSIEHELKKAIKNHELYLLYQPQVDAIHNEIIGFEALLRWNNATLGCVSPAEFIPVAEKSGDIVEIGEWVIQTVSSKIKELYEKGYEFGSISLNVSPVQLMKNNFLNNITEYFKEKSIPLNLLEIEITEGTLINFNKDKLSLFDEIIKEGIKIAIDDFGTGYSSLNYLTMLPINTLKIDKSFIDNICDEKNRAVIECIINLSTIMKYRVIAEGVESKSQMKLLMKSGCNTIQGYYFSKPVSENDLEAMLKINKNWNGGNSVGEFI